MLAMTNANVKIVKDAMAEWSARSPSIGELKKENSELREHIKELRCALSELIIAKDHKEQYGKDSRYLLMQATAWKDARKALQETEPKGE